MANGLIDKQEVICFFDKIASRWDDDMIKDDDVIEAILNNVGVEKDKKVLDVACGTGVLIPYYLKRNVNSITAIDISEKMIEIAKNKYKQTNIEFICDDILNLQTNQKYDCIVVYNAFPHFVDPEGLIKKLSDLLSEDGCLTIAHGMSRQDINKHHNNVMHISYELMDIEELASIFSKYLKIEVKISNEKMYQIAGRK